MDTGIIVTNHVLKEHTPFANLAKKFVKNVQLSAATEIAETKFIENLWVEDAKIAHLSHTLCKLNKELRRVQSWVLKQFPGEAGEFLFEEKGKIFETAGDALVSHSCQEHTAYKVHWNQRIGNECYNSFPVFLRNDSKPWFLNIQSRKIHRVPTLQPAHLATNQYSSPTLTEKYGA